jgi:hypothetical protein
LIFYVAIYNLHKSPELRIRGKELVENDPFNKCLSTDQERRLHVNRTDSYTSYEEDYSEFTDKNIRAKEPRKHMTSKPIVIQNIQKILQMDKIKEKGSSKLLANYSSHLLE